MSGFVVCMQVYFICQGGYGLVVPGADLPADCVEAAQVQALTPPAVGHVRERSQRGAVAPVALATSNAEKHG